MNARFLLIRILEWLFTIGGIVIFVFSFGSLVLTYLGWATQQGPADWSLRPLYREYVAWENDMFNYSWQSLVIITVGQVLGRLTDIAESLRQPAH